MSTFQIVGDQFQLDNQPFQIIAGAIHYFRVHPAYWEDRLRKLKACGLNTVETYVAWNFHEPRPGQVSFEGWADLAGYLRLAQDLGLKAIVRPGPYICSEWDLGGLPSWLLADPGMRLRSRYAPFLQAVERWFDRLFAELAPLQITQGGPIIAMQVENEYGYQANDRQYMEAIRDMMRARGAEVPLFTSDPAQEHMLCAGRLDDVLAVGNFGSDVPGRLAALRSVQPVGPLMCGEFWCGWFDHWTEEHHTRTPEEVTATLEDLLKAGASVSFYMFHGGTNFGFNNGANSFGRYEPTITSYDFSAPLSEAGDITPTYQAVRAAIQRHTGVESGPVPPDLPKFIPPPVELTERAPLLANLAALCPEPLEQPYPEFMEVYGQHTGFILYRTTVPGPRAEGPLRIQGLGDRAQVFADGRCLGILDRNAPEATLALAVPGESLTLDILVENMGRLNHGPYMLDRKGIGDAVYYCTQALHNWTVFRLPLDDLSGLAWGPADALDGPAFFRGHFTVDQPVDTFLRLPGFTKGAAWINGFNLGRFWRVGPQQALYVPAPLLRAGRNELVVLELESATAARAQWCTSPVWETETKPV